YTGAETIVLADVQVSIIATGTATGQAAVGPDGPDSRRVEVFNIAGDGTLAVSIAPFSAVDAVGNTAPGLAGASFTVDNTAPNAPVITTNGGADFETESQLVTIDGTTD